MHSTRWKVGAMAVLLALVSMCAERVVAQEQSIEAKWYLSGGLGMLQYEGDEELEDGVLGTIRLGYDYNEWFSLEGALALAPQLDENFRNSYGERISRLEETAGDGVHDTYGVGLSLDLLYHFTRWERIDPYLALGVGVIMYGEDVGGDGLDAAARVGGGLMYHFNDEWAVRVDGRTFIAGQDTEANAIIDGGVVWTWGAGIAPNIVAVDGPLDSDGDRLVDTREGELGTDPYNPDTDGDKLTDGEEVLDYETNPLEPDTDWDGLQDGEEVHRYQTDPNDRDTDDGGVADGHEVLTDNTNPREGHGADDLQLIELYIKFDYDKSVIKAVYFPELDIVGKVLSRNEEATAMIEGHADRKRLSDEAYNQRLSEERAKAVMTYLVETCKIDPRRLAAKGFGFSVPKAANDPKEGNPENRRVEVYIRSSPDADADAADQATPPVAADDVLAVEDK